MKKELNYIQVRLLSWADWRVRRDNGGLGFPKKSAFVKQSSGSFWTPEMDSQCYEIDENVSLLINERKQVILAFYTQTGTHEQKADRCGLSISTFYRRIQDAEDELSKILRTKVQTSAYK